MDIFLDFIRQPWHWSISGAMIVLVMFLLIHAGQRFGVSSSFRALCSIGGAGRMAEYFRFDWKKQNWLLVFVLGSILGGFISSQFLKSPEPVALAASTLSDLSEMGISAPTGALVPEDLFNFDFLLTGRGLCMFVLGGFLIGFGTRWAGGCTSGHAISGLANLQLPSLVAVVGFFIGGLTATHLLFPILFN